MGPVAEYHSLDWITTEPSQRCTGRLSRKEVSQASETALTLSETALGADGIRALSSNTMTP